MGQSYDWLFKCLYGGGINLEDKQMVYAGEEKKMAGRSVKKADRGERMAGKRWG